MISITNINRFARRPPSRTPLAFTLATLLLFAPGGEIQAGSIVVANRASGDISIIDTRADGEVARLALPPGANPPEPMYVVSTPAARRVFVGDRSNDRLVVYRAGSFTLLAEVAVGQGVFHMWSDDAGKQLWVVNDIDGTVSVVDPRRLVVLATIAMPADLLLAGARPHDVILSDDGRRAFVTFLDVPGASDVVVQFDTSTFLETARAAVGEDPHLSYNKRYDEIYLPCQGNSEVFVLDATTLAQHAVIPVPGAHGAVTSGNDQRFYTTNLSGGGLDAVFAIDTASNQIAGAPASAPHPVPHNLAITPNGRKLYATHSGPNDKVTVYAVSNRHPAPRLAGEVTVGANPFGLAYVP